MTLGTGVIRTLSRSFSKPAAGAYAAQVGGEIATFTIDPARIVLSEGNVTPASVTPGPWPSRITISGKVANEGGDEGDFNVNLTVDGERVGGQSGTLAPEQSLTIATVIELRRLPRDPPLGGIRAVGSHDVKANELPIGRYEVNAPTLPRTPVRNSHSVNRNTSSARSGNQSLDVGTGDVTLNTTNSIRLSIPVLARETVQVDRFFDTTSGIDIDGINVTVPIRDPDSGETLLNLRGTLEAPLRGTQAGDAATAEFASLNIETEEGRQDLSADDPNVGSFGASLDASLSLNRFPENISVEVSIKKELADEDRTRVELAAREDGKIVADEAATVSVETENLTTGDVAEVKVVMKVSAKWIELFGVENVRIAHVSDTGEVEILIPERCIETIPDVEFTCLGRTQRGFSEFSLLALVDIPALFSARNLTISPESVEPGEAVTITVDILNGGVQAGSFSAILKLRKGDGVEFEPIAVKEVDVAGGEAGTVTFFVIRGEEEQGVYSVEVEGRKGEFLRGEFSVFRRIDADLLLFSPDLVIDPAEVEPGQTVTISMQVLNFGDDPGSTEIELRINGALTEKRILPVGVGEFSTAVFEFVPPAEGTYTVVVQDPDQEVGVLTGEFTAAIPPEPADLRLSRLNISPLEVAPGGEVTITFRITNVGGETARRFIVLLRDGVEIASQDVEIPEFTAVPLTFTTIAPEEPRDYPLEIGLPEDPEVAPLTGVSRVVIPEGVVVESVTVSPRRVTTGELVTVTVGVVNVSDVEDTRTLTFIVDGEVKEERAVTLGPRETGTEIFTFAAPDVVGPHKLSVEGLERTFEVVRAIVPAVLNLVRPLTITPGEVQTGETVTVAVTLSNIGEEEGTTDIILRVRGQVIETREDVVVQGGKEITLRFEVVQDEVGDYDVEVEAPGAADVKILDGTFTVVAPPPVLEAILVIVPGTLTVEPDKVDRGDPVTISVNVRNEGDAAGSDKIALKVDGVLVEEKEVTLEPGQVETVTFTHVEEVEGTHKVEVDGLTAEFEVAKPAAFPIVLVIVPIIVVVLVGLGVLLYVRRRAGGGRSSSSAPGE